MIRKWFAVAALTVIAVLLLNTSGCARSQQLESITLTPAQGYVFEGPLAAGQFTAYGNYIHPRDEGHLDYCHVVDRYTSFRDSVIQRPCDVHAHRWMWIGSS